MWMCEQLLHGRGYESDYECACGYVCENAHVHECVHGYVCENGCVWVGGGSSLSHQVKLWTAGVG